MSNMSASPSDPWRSYLSLTCMAFTPLYIVAEVTPLHSLIETTMHVAIWPTAEILGLVLSIGSIVLGYAARASDPRPLVRLALITGWISLGINLLPILAVIIFLIAWRLGLIHFSHYVL